MLTMFRKLAKSWVAMLLIAVLAVAFAIWGINDVFRPVQRDAVAAGDGLTVTSREYDAALERTLNQIRAEQGQSLTKADAKAQGVTDGVLQRLIAQKSVNRIATKMGVTTPDSLVAETIRTDPAFKSPVTGGFDTETYRALLRQNQLTELEYERNLREGLTRRQIISATAAGVRAPTSLASFIVAFQSERRTVVVAEIPPTVAGAIPEPTDADLKKLYDASKAALATPEYRKLTLILARNADFEAKVDVPEAKLQEIYAFEKERRGKPETRTFAQITAPSQAAAQNAAKRLAAGEDPAAVAKAVGGALTPFTDTARSGVPDSVVAAAVFAAKPGEVIGPIQGKLGAWSAARLTSVTPGVTPSYEQLKPELRAGFARDEAMTLLNKATEVYDDAISGGQSPEDAAKTAGLVVQTIPAVDAQGRDPNGQPVAELANGKDILEAVFATAQDESTDFTPLGDAGYARARVDAIIPPGVRGFDQVKTDLVAAWRNREVRTRMEAVVTRIKAAVAGGKSFADAAKAEKLRVAMNGAAISRQEASQGPAAQLGGAIFAAAKGEVVSAPLAGAPVLLVAHVTDIQRDDPKANPAALEAARQQADQMLANDVLESLQRAAVNAAKVKRNDKLLDSIIGVTQDDAATTP